jgi:hypothetical protein
MRLDDTIYEPAVTNYKRITKITIILFAPMSLAN